MNPFSVCYNVWLIPAQHWVADVSLLEAAGNIQVPLPAGGVRAHMTFAVGDSPEHKHGGILGNP